MKAENQHRSVFCCCCCVCGLVTELWIQLQSVCFLYNRNWYDTVNENRMKPSSKIFLQEEVVMDKHHYWHFRCLQAEYQFLLTAWDVCIRFSPLWGKIMCVLITLCRVNVELLTFTAHSWLWNQGVTKIFVLCWTYQMCVCVRALTYPWRWLGHRETHSLTEITQLNSPKH